MTDALNHGTARPGFQRKEDRRVIALVRLAIGFVQGLVLWGLFRSTDAASGAADTWPATQPLAFGVIFAVTAYLPVVALAGVGRLRIVTLAIWCGVVAAVMAGLAWHDVTRSTTAHLDDPFVSPVMMVFAATALFIAHHLIAPADRRERLIAPYDGYFDAAWMAGVQLALSIAFTGAFWLLLLLGAALFKVIGLSFLGDLIREAWFALPMTGLVFASAVQLTDVRDGLIRGVRTVALMLLSWLLLVLTVLVAGFLAALPFTGLEGLWSTGSATALVLSATGALIVLVNAAYQDGQADNRPPQVLRIAAQVASVLLTPLIVIAAWGLILRIGQHGLTPERIIACACVLVGAVYAAGYGLGALVPIIRRGSPWMKALEPTNIAAAVLAVAVILALFSPLADPARLSVGDQMGRLQRGAVSPADFDYAFLRFDSGKAGERALHDLTRNSNPEIARRAREAQAADSRYDARPAEPWTVAMVPAGAALPQSFLAQPPEETGLGCSSGTDCVGRLIDLDDDGRDDLVIAQPNRIDVFTTEDTGVWTLQGSYALNTRCTDAEQRIDARDIVRQGRFDPAPPPRFPDLASGAARPWAFDPTGCPP